MSKFSYRPPSAQQPVIADIFAPVGVRRAHMVAFSANAIMEEELVAKNNTKSLFGLFWF